MPAHGGRHPPLPASAPCAFCCRPRRLSARLRAMLSERPLLAIPVTQGDCQAAARAAGSTGGGRTGGDALPPGPGPPEGELARLSTAAQGLPSGCCWSLDSAGTFIRSRLPGSNASKLALWQACWAGRPPSLPQEIESASVELEAAVDAQSQAKREKDERICELEAQLEAARCADTAAHTSCLFAPTGRRVSPHYPAVLQSAVGGAPLVLTAGGAGCLNGCVDACEYPLGLRIGLYHAGGTRRLQPRSWRRPSWMPSAPWARWPATTSLRRREPAWAACAAVPRACLAGHRGRRCSPGQAAHSQLGLLGWFAENKGVTALQSPA